MALSVLSRFLPLPLRLYLSHSCSFFLLPLIRGAHGVPPLGMTPLRSLLRRVRIGSSYVNKVEDLVAAEKTTLPEGLYEACLKTGRTPTAGEVKMIYSTKVLIIEARRRLGVPMLLRLLRLFADAVVSAPGSHLNVRGA